MHGPDGVDYPNKTIYHEVEKYSRLVYDHGGNDDRPPMFRVTVNFSEAKEKTKMEMSMRLPTPEAAQETKKFIKKAGGNATWDRLAEYLEKNVSGKDQFVINRAFDVPLETMFEMWTNPKHMAQWPPPTGSTMKFINVDVRAGGKSFYSMENDSALKFFGLAEYLEITRPNRLVYTQQFCDENEKLAKHPMAPVWPPTMLTTVTLSAEASDRTRVTVTWEPYGEVTDAEIKFFVEARGGMTQGWTGSLDKLEDYVKTV